MAVIKAFRGVRFNQQKAGDLNNLVTQPYDKISPALQQEYYAKSPYNIVRLIKNNTDQPYSAAATTLTQWLTEGIVQAEEKAAMYVYHQKYLHNGQPKVRKALTCLARTEDYAAKVVLPHEKTHAGPKLDRLNLLRATNANFGQIFLLYDDPQKVVDAVTAKYTQQEPLEQVTDHFGDVHTLWKIDDHADLEVLTQALADKQLLIADGHHRYGTACNFTVEKGFQLGTDNPYGYVLSTLVNIQDEGLTILPTHRLIKDSEVSVQDFLVKSADYFQVTKVSEQTMLQTVDQAKDNTFGLITAEGFYLLKLTDSHIMSKLSDNSPQWNSLDVAVVQKLIVEHLLKITDEQLENKLSYARSHAKAIENVQKGLFEMMIYLKATAVEQIIKIAQNGEYMPQKSTDFYPKLLTGMVFQKYDF